MQIEYGCGEKYSRLREITRCWVLGKWRGAYFIKVSQRGLTKKVTKKKGGGRWSKHCRFPEAKNSKQEEAYAKALWWKPARQF